MVLNKYHKFECDFYRELRKKTLGQNKHGFVTWPKQYIVLIDDDEEDEDDAHASPARDFSPPSPPYRPRDFSPPSPPPVPNKKLAPTKKPLQEKKTQPSQMPSQK